MTTELEQAETSLALAESKMKIEEVNVRTAIIKQAARPLSEHWDTVPRAVDRFGSSDPHSFSNGFPYRHAPWSLLSDREDGKFFPLYETEMDLARIRGQSRNLAAFTSTTIGAVDALRNYVYGTGFTYTVHEKEGVQAEGLVKQAQSVIDAFIEENDFTGVVDVENHQRSREDGEAFIRLQAEGQQIFVDMIEPDNVTEPANKREIEDWLTDTSQMDMLSFVPSWKFGVLTPERQTWRALGYHVVFDSSGSDWEFIPARRMVHIKRNVPRKAKRGVSDYVPVWEDIEAEARLRKNTSEGAAIQAAIAFVREHVPGISKDDIVDFVAANATGDYEKPIKSGTRNVKAEKFQPGTVKDIPAGMKYHAGPMGTLRSPIFIEVAQFILRSIGQRWSFPEFIISGDASNSNFASTLMAESPFVKARECDQQFYKRQDSELFWKVLRIAWEMGLLGGSTWQQVRASIELKIDAPEVASRDKQKQASTDQVLQQMGVKSRRTIANEHDLDFDDELQNIADDGDPVPSSGEGEQPQQAGMFPESMTESFFYEHKPGKHKQEDHGREGSGSGDAKNRVKGSPGDEVEIPGARGTDTVTLGKHHGKQFNPPLETSPRTIVEVGNIEVSSDEFGFREKDDDFFYHVTDTSALLGIKKDGMVTGKEGTFGGVNDARSENKVFFTERSGVNFWHGKVEDALFSSSDDPPDVTVVRFPKSATRGQIETDTDGSRDSGHDAYLVKSTSSKTSESYTPLSPVEQGAIVGAMESVRTLEEAREILRDYP
jgi:hypothetical protein